MVVTRVIQDSDDEGSNASPVKSSPQRAPGIHDSEQQRGSGATTDTATRSTDLSFFQRVYEEQQMPADANLNEFDQTGTMDAGAAQDFTPDRGRAQKKRPSTGDDPWDVPSSPERIPAASKSNPNRPSRTKRLKQMDQPDLPSDGGLDVNLIALPDNAPGSYAMAASQTAPIASDYLPATAQGVLEISIDQGHMTASQVREYQPMYSSNNANRYEEAPSPPPDFFRNEETRQTSSITTIAYPTPSRYASSGRRSPRSQPASLPNEIPQSNPAASAGKRKRPVLDQRGSSPDVIADLSSEGRHAALPTGQHPEDRQSSGENIVNLDNNDDDPLSGDIAQGTATAQHNDELKPVPVSDEGLGKAAPEVVTISSSPIQETRSRVPAAKEPKKRGRKKKRRDVAPESTSEPVPDAAVDPPQLLDNLPAATPEKPKRKRGRPKKTDSTAAARDMQQASSLIASEPLDDRPPASGLENHEVAGLTATDGEEGTEGVLNEGSENGPSLSRSCNEEPVKTEELKTATIETKENKAPGNTVNGKEATKGRANTPQPAKAVYRVGLSRRSRIAPLLKSIRK
ncbi:uncharacterized protein E0L32_007343 [Thyridium curvatum]|uniref:Uncharacterized protein n=1 Tax=Thyridium curvatum TaxID=1093900 RepID=A0A507AMD7_9PEZI|nr:uncharacterized protein E0L32_007343 [Thyridium curvatum]TPX11845.1 hypothetical protein E0L32_007343 [Thyridium curvatum]